MSELGVQVNLWRGHREACSQACRSSADLQSCDSTMTEKYIWSWAHNPLPQILCHKKLCCLLVRQNHWQESRGPWKNEAQETPAHCRKSVERIAVVWNFFKTCLKIWQERNFANAYRRKGLRGVLVESLNGCNRKVESTTVGSRGRGSRSTSSVTSKI